MENKLWHTYKRIRFFLRGSYQVRGFPSFKDVSNRFLRQQYAVQFFYLLYLLVFCVMQVTLNQFDFSSISSPVAYLKLVSWMGLETSYHLITGLGFLSVFILILNPNYRILRILAFFCLSQSFAFYYSAGAVLHSKNTYLWVAFILIFLPNTNGYVSRAKKVYYSTVCYMTMLVALSTYTMSGFWKIAYGTIYNSFHENLISFLNPEAMSMHLSAYILKHNYDPPLADFIINRPILGFVFLWGAIYMQFFGFFAAFRERATTYWVFAILSFHVLSVTIMHLPFYHHGVTIVFTIVCFGFYRLPHSDLSLSFYSLPLIGDFAWFIKTKIVKI